MRNCFGKALGEGFRDDQWGDVEYGLMETKALPIEVRLGLIRKKVSENVNI